MSNPFVKTARWNATVIAVAAVLAWVPCAAHTVDRWRCTMPDGTVRTMVQNLAELEQDASIDCRRVQLSALEPWNEVDQRDIFQSLQSRQYVFASRRPRSAGATVAFRATPTDSVAALIVSASRRQGVDPRLVSALISVESQYRPDARSPVGALGLMQVMPATAAQYGVLSEPQLLDPGINIDVGTRHLRDLLLKFDGQLSLVLAAYNAGEGAVQRYGMRIPPYPETQDYVRRVMALADPFLGSRRDATTFAWAR
jgi:soluble lytic murein transglycosylase-like protein